MLLRIEWANHFLDRAELELAAFYSSTETNYLYSDEMVRCEEILNLNEKALVLTDNY